MPRLSIDMAALEKAYSSSFDFEENSFFQGEEEEDAVQMQRTTALPKRTPKKITPTTRRKDGRSSTMPGFASRNVGQQRAFLDGIKMAEQRSGTKFVDTPEMKKKRRKQSNEAMYKATASVPDSLVRFANEIHLVSVMHTHTQVRKRKARLKRFLFADRLLCCLLLTLGRSHYTQGGEGTWGKDSGFDSDFGSERKTGGETESRTHG
jgi:hypothetical protein